MVHIQSIDTRNAEFSHRHLLDQTDDFLPFLRCLTYSWSIEDGADLVLADGVLHLIYVHNPLVTLEMSEDIDSYLSHLTDLLLNGHP